MFWAVIRKILVIFIWKFSVFGGKIYYIFKLACFRNEIETARSLSRIKTCTSRVCPDRRIPTFWLYSRVYQSSKSKLITCHGRCVFNVFFTKWSAEKKSLVRRLSTETLHGDKFLPLAWSYIYIYIYIYQNKPFSVVLHVKWQSRLGMLSHRLDSLINPIIFFIYMTYENEELILNKIYFISDSGGFWVMKNSKYQIDSKWTSFSISH